MAGKAISIGKFESGSINEDAAIARNSFIAVSDGAGGGGLYADRWSKYLLEHLPSSPFYTFGDLDSWVDGIWEPFYLKCESDAKCAGGMVLDKFYKEGSFATLAVVWKVASNKYHWITYGDSVAFCYNKSTRELQYSFDTLADFNLPPFLISCKDPLNPEGFRSGDFTSGHDSVIFVTSDALAHYVILMYLLQNASDPLVKKQIDAALHALSKNSKFVEVASSYEQGKVCNSIDSLLQNCDNENHFEKHLRLLYQSSLIALDDYSIAYFSSVSNSTKENKILNAISKLNRLPKCDRKRRR